MENTTCQICARIIKAKTGVIAHHGYQRPDRGSGWQTESCWGARHLPYEQSSNVLPDYILHVKRYMENQVSLKKALLENPPEVIIDQPFPSSKPIEYKRPEGFDAIKNVDPDRYHSYQSYEYEHYQKHRAHEREIKNAKVEIARAEKRLADWVAPKK